MCCIGTVARDRTWLHTGTGRRPPSGKVRPENNIELLAFLTSPGVLKITVGGKNVPLRTRQPRQPSLRFTCRWCTSLRYPAAAPTCFRSMAECKSEANDSPLIQDLTRVTPQNRESVPFRAARKSLRLRIPPRTTRFNRRAIAQLGKRGIGVRRAAASFTYSSTVQSALLPAVKNMVTPAHPRRAAPDGYFKATVPSKMCSVSSKL